MWSIGITTVMVLWSLAFFIAAPWLAAWFHGTDTPTGDQIKQVKLILSAPVAGPILLLFLWSKWDDRRRRRREVRQALHSPKFEDPSHELRLGDGRRD